MENNLNKIIIIITAGIIILLIVIPTIININKIHNDRLLIVMEKRVVESAIKCIKEGNCTSDKILLEELYEKNYLDKETNPVTREYLNVASFIEKVDNEYIFNEIK